MLSTTNSATAAPIAVRWVLTRVKCDIPKQKRLHNAAATAILRNITSEGAFIIVIAQSR